MQLLVVDVGRLAISAQHFLYLPRWVVNGPAPFLWDVNSVVCTRFLLFNHFNSFLCRYELSFLRLRCLPQIKALLASLFGLEHLVLHESLEDKIFLVVVIDAPLHGPAFLFLAGIGRSRQLLTRQAVCPLLQLIFQLVKAGRGTATAPLGRRQTATSANTVVN